MVDRLVIVRFLFRVLVFACWQPYYYQLGEVARGSICAFGKGAIHGNLKGGTFLNSIVTVLCTTYPTLRPTS